MTKSQLEHGSYYHILKRGNNKDPIFRTEANYQYFLGLYRKYIVPIADLYAYCLLPTHFHILIQLKKTAEIGAFYPDGRSLYLQVRAFLGRYIKKINTVNGRSGPLFTGNIISLSGLKDSDLCHLVPWVHKTPQAHGIVADYRLWPFSSYYPFSRRDRRSLLARRLFADDDLYNRIMEMHGDGSSFGSPECLPEIGVKF